MDIRFLGAAREVGRSATRVSEGRSPSGNRTQSHADGETHLLDTAGFHLQINGGGDGTDHESPPYPYWP